MTRDMEKTMERIDPLELISDPKLSNLLNISLRTFARWDADPNNDFPAPVIINVRKYRRRAEIEAWLHKRALASLEPAAKPARRPPTATASQA